MATESGEAVKELADLGRLANCIDVLELQGADGAKIQILGRSDAQGNVIADSAKKFIDEYRASPERMIGTARALTLQSFIDLINRHKDADTAVFGDIDSDSPSFLAVLDYHTMDHKPRFGQHRVSYKFPISPEWSAWKTANGVALSQGEWAAFIEEHIAELSAPMDAEKAQFEPLFQTKFALPTDLVTMSRGMQIAVEATVKEVRSLQSGEVEIVYDEVHKDGSGQKLIVPGLFVISIPLFIGADKTRLIARLRYRRQNQKLIWFYQLYQVENVMRESLLNDFEKVGRETSLPTFEASPEDAR